MKTRANVRKAIVAGFCSLTGVSALAGWNLSLTDGWRVTGGAEFGGPVNATVRTRGTGPRGVVPVSQPGESREQAIDSVQKDIDKIRRGGRVSFGRDAFIDPDSWYNEANRNWTQNWRLPTSSVRAGRAGEYAYREVDATVSSSRLAASEDDTSVGASVEVSKTIWTGDSVPLGVDLSFCFAWLRRNNLVNAEGVTYARDETIRTGAAEMTLGDQARGWLREYDEGWLPGPGETIGVGSPDDFGPVMDVSQLGWRDRPDRSSSTHYAERVAVRGDWEEWDFRFALKPWWDVADWLRVYGTLGVEIAKTCFEMDVSWSNGTERRHRSRNIDGWQVNGIAGLGVALRWKSMTLGADVLARFLQQDVTIDDSEISGKIDRQRWFARAYLGFEF